MPPRPARQIHGVNDRSIAQWFYEQPIISRTLLVAYLITGIGITIGLTPLMHMYLDWSSVFRLPIPQVWRLLLNFTVIGKPSINFLFNLIWLMRYGTAYEQSKFGANTADAITMLGVGCSTILLIDCFIRPLHTFFHGQSLIFMFVYLWSKQNPTSIVSLFGLIQFQAQYLPFALTALDLIQGGGIGQDIIGILSGHMYYFLTEIYPRRSGRNLIQTPTWLYVL